MKHVFLLEMDHEQITAKQNQTSPKVNWNQANLHLSVFNSN